MIRTRVFPLAVLLAACGAGDESTQTASAGRPGGPGARVPTVAVQPVARGSIARQVTVSGIVEPLRTIAVNSQLSGALTRVVVEEGDAVRAGAVLARLDDRELASQLAAAEAAYQVAEAAFQRAEQLRDRRIITLPEYERDRTALSAARAQLDQLRMRIGYATVNAPVSGVIIEKNVETGDVIGNQSHLFTIADVSQIVARVGVSELDVVDLAAGDRVTITLDALPSQQLLGSIRRVFPSGDPTTRLVPVEVVFDQASARLARPGFLARVTFDLATSDNVLLVPVAAVLGGEGSSAVFVIDNETAIRRTVNTGLVSQGRIEIVSGLSEGENVVVTGNNTLRDGMTVRTVPALGEPQSSATTAAQPPAAATAAAASGRPAI
ncbi:MAG: efflux RND transporter periplasmic adaptor subunit [Gemmatimonadota bacterium]